MPDNKQRLPAKLVGVVWDEFFTASQSFAGCPYRFVYTGSNPTSVYLATGASNPAPIGVIQNTPLEGGLARVRMMGKSIIAACFSASNASPGTFMTVGSHGGATPSVCGLFVTRWAGSVVLTTASAAYGENWLLGPGMNSCAPAIW